MYKTQRKNGTAMLKLQTPPLRSEVIKVEKMETETEMEVEGETKTEMELTSEVDEMMNDLESNGEEKSENDESSDEPLIKIEGYKDILSVKKRKRKRKRKGGSVAKIESR